MPDTLSSQGFLMPAEWGQHSATWLSWPKNTETFPKSAIGKVENAFCEMIRALSSGEKVKILVDSDSEEQRVERILTAEGAYSGDVLFSRIKSSDVWVRDYCPIFITNRKTGKKAAVKWVFNAWGGKYGDLKEDDKAGEKIGRGLESAGIRVFRPGIVLEGGSIDVNGEGALLTTEQCLLNKNRNPSLSKSRINTYLSDYFGASRVVWLKEGIEGDDTDGHVDDFARFVSKNTVICAREKSRGDPNHAALETGAALLTSSGFDAIPIPMPSPIIDQGENRRLPASYANFYIANRCVLLPVFGDKCDEEAAEIIGSCFAGREIVPINAKELVHGYGGIHCVTQQEPK